LHAKPGFWIGELVRSLCSRVAETPTQRVASYVPPVSGNSARPRGFSSGYLTDIEEMRDVTRTKEAIGARRSFSAAGTFRSDKF
jgi:hypothetical protein